MVIFCFLQIPSSVFSLFYHFRLAKTTKKQADDAALSFILGVEIFNTIMWLLTYIIIFCCQPSFVSPLFLWLMVGICLAEAVAAFFFYFRNDKTSTATFISRRIAKCLATRSQTVKSRSDAITLGFISCLPELLFTLPLYITCSAFLQNENALPRAALIIIAVVIAVVPLFVIRAFFRTDHNLAEIQRLRVKLKPHFRFILLLAYIAATISLIDLAIINM